jgi:Spy/CpxP family protein refolding chaperone
MKARLFVLPIFIAATLFAQGPHGGFGRNSSGTPPTPAEIVAREVQMLTRFLSLDATQQSAATTALTNAQAQLALNAPTLKTDRAQLVDAIKANQAGVIDTLTSTIANLQGQNDAIRAKAAAAIYATLTAEQKTKLGNGLGPLMGGGPGRGFGRF